MKKINDAISSTLNLKACGGPDEIPNGILQSFDAWKKKKKKRMIRKNLAKNNGK